MKNSYPEELGNIINNVYIQQCNVEASVQGILKNHNVSNPDNFAAWLIKSVTFIDLTTLAGDDTRTNVSRLCVKAAYPLSNEICEGLGLNNNEDLQIRTAAVCVYPSRVKDAYSAIDRLGLVDKIQIASVATGFPEGLYPLNTRLQEIKYAVTEGASEIDVVLDRSLVLAGKWNDLYLEVTEMKKACGNAPLKVILGVGHLGTLANVYKASMVSMFAGADFIKTSTGKEAVNATLPVGLVMCRAIRHYYTLTNRKVGLKPAGGLKTPRDAVNWLVLVYCELGQDWLVPNLFRIGASSLLGAIERHLYEYVTGVTVPSDKFNFI